MISKVSIDRDGLALAGDLYVPDNFDPARRYRAVIVTGSFSSVKEQMAAIYGRAFADHGFIALSLDYAHYGASAGQPRQYESPQEKLRDLQAAVTYLLGQPFVQAVGMVGVCTSASNALYLAAGDNRLKAVATVAGFLPDAGLLNMMFGEAELARRRQAGAAARRKYERTGEVEMVPAYSHTDPTAVNLAPAGTFDYYFNPQRGGVPEWTNKFAVMAYEEWLQTDPVSQASSVRVPAIMVHSDGCTFPEQARKTYALLKGEKTLAWGEGTHFDYYDNPRQVAYAVRNITEFFSRHMA